MDFEDKLKGWRPMAGWVYVMQISKQGAIVIPDLQGGQAKTTARFRVVALPSCGADLPCPGGFLETDLRVGDEVGVATAFPSMVRDVYRVKIVDVLEHRRDPSES